MADVRSFSGIPTITAFGGTTTPSPGTPLVVDTTTGDTYVAITGDVVKRTGVSSSGTGLSAAGTTQGTATALTAGVNVITTVAANSGVILTAGPFQVVYNGGANPLNVYPPTSAAINQLAVNTPILLAIRTSCVFWYSSATLWIGVLSA